MESLRDPLPAAMALALHREALESALRAAVGEASTAMATAARYVMGWQDAHGHPSANGGKRIRPALCLLAAELLGGTVSAAMPGAVAVELVHNFSLVHDEVQDHDAERHHRPTVWALLGEGQAINVGNFLYTRAVQTLALATGPVERRMQALMVLNQAIGEMLQGQWQDLAFESRDNVSVPEYLDMAAGKTGALLGAPLEMGALLAGADTPTAALLGQWGRQVGLAFQAQDDYLGIWGDPTVTGKSNTNDIARRKKSLPVVHALAFPQAHSVVMDAYTSATIKPEVVQRVTAALAAVGSDVATRDHATRFANEADALLEQVPLSPAARTTLRAVAQYMVDRAG